MEPLTLDRQRNSFFLSLCPFIFSVCLSVTLFNLFSFLFYLFFFLSSVTFSLSARWVKAITFAWFAFRPNKKLKKNRHWGWNSPKIIYWFLAKTIPQQKHLGEFHLGVECLGSRRQKVEEIFFWRKRKCFKKGKKVA